MPYDGLGGISGITIFEKQNSCFCWLNFPVIIADSEKCQRWNLSWYQWNVTCLNIWFCYCTLKQRYTCELPIIEIFNSATCNYFTKIPRTIIHIWRWIEYLNILNLACGRNFYFVMQFPKWFSEYLENSLKTDII